MGATKEGSWSSRGPQASAAAGRAAELVSTADDEPSLTLSDVQSTVADGGGGIPPPSVVKRRSKSGSDALE
ncbi:hypothetical protein ACFR97_03795 [Haloplanus litoreus]|uniref:Uncharacterized protein n=1 Tax=Haloplanus litoreus TaxID=767515 RepID=A0ABD5ZZT5_9EURY